MMAMYGLQKAPEICHIGAALLENPAIIAPRLAAGEA